MNSWNLQSMDRRYIRSQSYWIFFFTFPLSFSFQPRTLGGWVQKWGYKAAWLRAKLNLGFLTQKVRTYVHTYVRYSNTISPHTGANCSKLKPGWWLTLNSIYVTGIHVSDMRKLCIDFCLSLMKIGVPRFYISCFPIGNSIMLGGSTSGKSDFPLLKVRIFAWVFIMEF